MPQFLGCFIIIIFGIFIAIVAALRNIYDAAFGQFQRRKSPDGTTHRFNRRSTTKDRRKEALDRRRRTRGKVYTDDVGEYIDYEDLH